jgi:Type IIA topoisomerase (DNA gyrase/topo II, topoisomerase IV), A subunit
LLSSNVNKIFIASKNGKGFISEIKNLISNQRKGRQFFNLKSNDNLIKVFELNKSHIACVSKLQKLLVFGISSIPELQKGVGVNLIKIKDKDYLSDVININPDDGLSWSTGNKNRKVDNINFWIGKRAQAGKKIPKFFNKNLKFND